MTYFAVRISGKPADEEHHYGHGKVESVSALAETALLFVLSGVVIWEALQRLFGGHGHAVEATIWAFAVIVVSIVVDFFRARVLYRVAAETSSEALEADALHFGSDMWSSLAVLIGLGLVRARISLGGFGRRHRGRGLHLHRRLAARPAHHRDAHRHRARRAPPSKITAAVLRIPGVVAIDRVRVRQAGDVLFVDLVVAVSRTLAARPRRRHQGTHRAARCARTARRRK